MRRSTRTPPPRAGAPGPVPTQHREQSTGPGSRTSTSTTSTALRTATTGGLRAIEQGRAPRGSDRDTRSAARSRRRFARRQWRRRWLTWRPVLTFVLAVAVGVAGVWLVLFSSVLAVRDVRVTGTSTVPASQVRTLAGIRRGTPLARIDAAGVRARVSALAPVRSVEVHREWPHTLVVEVTERTPVAVVSIGQQLRSLDADGAVFGSYDTPPPELPRIETVDGTRPEALREAATVVGALPPALARRVDHAEVVTVDEVTLVLRDDRTVRWGSSADSPLKAEVLAQLLNQPGTTYDVSVPGQPTVSGPTE